MKSYLTVLNLWSVVENTPLKIKVDDIMSQNSKVMALLILSCEDHIISLLNPDDLASTAWKNLEKHYGNAGFSA